MSVTVKHISLFILFAILVSLSIFFRNLTHQKSDIDKLESWLLPIKQKLPLNSTVSFLTNITDNSLKLEMYFQAQFVMVPVIILEKTNGDTVLSIQRKDMPKVITANVDTLAYIEAKDLEILLFKR